MTDSTSELNTAKRVIAGGTGPEVVPVANDEVDVTFAYQCGAQDGPVVMVGGFVSGGLVARVMPRLPGSDIASRTWRLPADFMGTYLFWVGHQNLELPEPFEQLLPTLYSDAGKPIPDPSNPDRFVYPVDPENPGEPMVHSILRCPQAPPDQFAGAPMLGTLTEHRVPSRILGDERRVWVHESTVVPGATSPWLMVVFDGGVYAHLMHTPEIVDAMVASGELPPMLTLYCHYVSDEARHAELACREDFASFVVDELVPWAAARWSFSENPAQTIVAGSSLGGLSSAWLAYRHPERFGNVLASSPSFGWHPDNPIRTNLMAQLWAEDGPVGVRFYVEMGLLETGVGEDARSWYDHTQDFVAAARSHGNHVEYQDFCGGHDYFCWQATFPRGLRSLAGLGR